MSTDHVPMTREGYDKLKAELDHMQNIRMIEVTKRIVGLDRMTANGFGHGVLTQTQCVYFLPGGLELIHQLQDESARIGCLYKGWQGIEQKCALAKLTESNPEPR